jgi:hypothetical protein
MRRDSYRVDERTPFYLIGTLLLGTTILLSLVSMFHSPNGTDFFPEGGYYQGNYILDHTYIHKVGWYLSHFTYQFVLLLFIYFLLALFHKRSIPFFKTIAPASFALCIMYVYLLYPKQPLPSYQLQFSTIFSHFMTVFLVLC